MNDIERYDNPVNSDASATDVRYREALDCIEKQQFEEALAILEQLASESPREARVLYARAVANLSTGEFRKAGTDLLRTIAINRNFLPAYKHLGFVQLTMGKEDSAIRTLKKALALDPGFAGAYSVLGDVYMDCGEHEKALEAFNKALELEPDHAEPHCKLAMYYLSRGDMKGLRREYDILRHLDTFMAEQIANLLPE
jgi:tetratricopeptide (TPR) repeat protein